MPDKSGVERDPRIVCGGCGDVDRRSTPCDNCGHVEFVSEEEFVANTPVPPRDPRKDPKAGDVLAKVQQTAGYYGQTIKRHVLRVDANEVHFFNGKYDQGRRENQIFLTNWRKWAKNAEIITRADGHGGGK